MRITGQLLRSRSNRPLNQVRYLDLSSTNIVTLNQLELCPKLTTLIASHNRLESVPNLDCCPELWKLDLSHNKLQDINGLYRFSVLGCLVLSNNCLDWSDLEGLHQTHILELSLHGNPRLEKDPYYRMHIIDCLPQVWMLDGRLITSAERQQVRKFFSKSELTERPVRHKISRKKRFTPTPLQNLAVTGVFGEKTEHWMKRFSLHEKLTQELDRRRLCYLAFNLQEEFHLQSQCSNSNESKTDEEIFMAVVDQRENDKEKSNMLLLLLVAALEFDIPEQVLQQTLDIAKLTKIGSHDTKDVFLLPKKQQCSMASLLLSGVKIDRDAKLDDGLYDCLYLCLYDLVSEWHKLTNNHNIPRKSGVRNILAAEIVQLFCIVPAFLMLLEKDTGLLELVSSATKEPDIAEQLYSLVVEEKSKGTKPGEMLQEMGSFILKKVHKKCFQFLHKPATNILPEKPEPPLRTSSYTKSLNTKNEAPQRSQSTPGFTRRQNIPRTKHDITGKKIRTSLSPNVKSLERLPALGDQVITSDQTCGHIVAMPEKNIALVKLDRIPAHGLQQLNMRNRKADNGNRFIYVNKELLVWNCQGYWKVQETTKVLGWKWIQDAYLRGGNKGQPRQSEKERSSQEAYLANTIRKQLPVEVWMSFSTLQNSSNNPEKRGSESNGSAITQHVRELVKECIEHAKITNETSIQDEIFHKDDTSLENKTNHENKISLEDVTQQQPEEEEKDVQLNETTIPVEGKVHLYENENKDDSELPEFSADDNMISRTENERLEAWKFFRLRNLEERIIPVTPYPTSRIEPEGHKHDVYTKAGKRISFPLPGWMEDFQSKNRPRSSGTNNVRYARKSAETERRWTPIILNSANFPSGTSEGFKRENMWEYRREPQVSRPRRHQSAQAILKPK